LAANAAGLLMMIVSFLWFIPHAPGVMSA